MRPAVSNPFSGPKRRNSLGSPSRFALLLIAVALIGTGFFYSSPAVDNVSKTGNVRASVRDHDHSFHQGVQRPEQEKIIDFVKEADQIKELESVEDTDGAEELDFIEETEDQTEELNSIEETKDQEKELNSIEETQEEEKKTDSIGETQEQEKELDSIEGKEDQAKEPDLTEEKEEQEEEHDAVEEKEDQGKGPDAIEEKEDQEKENDAVEEKEDQAKKAHSTKKKPEEKKEVQKKKPPSPKKKPEKPDSDSIVIRETLELNTKYGVLRILLRPDLSPESVDYIKKMAGQKKCNACEFYRSEYYLLQGVFASRGVPPNTVKGKCPKGVKKPAACSNDDPACDCHGPIMTRGMVAWTAGSTGPDFFVNLNEEPVEWWGPVHTVWGQILDHESFGVLHEIYLQPVVRSDDKIFLAETLKYTAKVVQEREKKHVIEKGGSSAQTLVLTTSYGPLYIVLRPDLSPESTAYIQDLVAQGKCSQCKFYRTETWGLLQGVVATKGVEPSTAMGKCPVGLDPPMHCPEYNPHCGCHGPVMTRGMVAWAAGATGPDFFVNTQMDPVTHWSTQHTVFGEIQDEDSLAIVKFMNSLPTTEKGMQMLDEEIPFTAHLEG